MIEGDVSWCAYPDAEWYKQCDYNGQINFWTDEATQYCYAYVITFDSCHVIDGGMYFIPERQAYSVCYDGNVVGCYDATNLGEMTCTAGCVFDGVEAMCK